MTKTFLKIKKVSKLFPITFLPVFSALEWFKKLRQQLVDLRALFRKESAVSSVNSLLRRQQLLEKVWTAFLNAYIEVVLLESAEISSDELALARSSAAKIYADAKDVLDTAYKVTSAMDDQVQPIERPLGEKIQDHFLSIISIPKLPSTFKMDQLRELIDKVEFHARMIERLHSSTCPMFLCVTIELKLDEETYWEWKTTTADPSQPPSIWSLINFLEQRWAEGYRQLDTKPAAREVRRREVEKELSPTPKYLEERRQTFVRFCRCCRTLGHKMGMCARFRRWSLKRRVDFLSRHRLCANCFKDQLDGHDQDRCDHKATCFNCGEKHHVLVCYYEKRRDAFWSHDSMRHPQPEYQYQDQYYQQELGINNVHYNGYAFDSAGHFGYDFEYNFYQ